MADLPKTIKISELPEVSSVNDTDVLIIEDASVTHKITSKNLMEYIKNHEDMNAQYIPKSYIGAASGVAPLDSNKKVPSSNLNFGVTSTSVFAGNRGKALEDGLDTHLLDTDIHHTHSNKTVLDNTTASFTTTLLNKLNGISAGATAYTHPTYTAKSSALYKVTVDGTGHVSAAIAATKEDIIALLGYTPSGSSDTNTTYTLTKSGSTITLTGSDGSTTSVTDSNTTYTLSNITGTLAITKGGTGATDEATARTNLGLGSAATYNATGTLANGNYGLPTSHAVFNALTGKADAVHGHTFGSLEFIPAENAGYGGFIDFHHNGSTEDYTSRIIEYTPGNLTVQANMTVQASTNYTTNQLRNTVFVTTDPGAGVSTTHANGSIICVYE